MNFDLLPCELPSEGIACEGEVAFELNFGGQVCQFRRAENRFNLYPYFRFKDAPDEHFLLARLDFWSRGRGSHPVELRPAEYPITRFAKDDSGLREECQQAFEMNAWGRYFCLNADLNGVQNPAEVAQAKWNVFLLANGQGVLDNLPHNREIDIGFKGWNSTAPFRWHHGAAPEILRAGTASVWLEWFQEESRNPESTIAFAHELAGHTEDEAALRCAYWVNGNRQEWEKVSRWILHTESSLWENSSEGETVQWSYQLTEAGEAPQQEGGFLARTGQQKGLFTHDPASRRLQRANQYFSPFLDPFLINRHLSIEHHRHHMKFLRVSASAPSAHERLEAALNLKVWARSKFSPSEIELLCGVNN